MARKRASVATEHRTETGRIRQLPLTEQRKTIFLRELALHGVVAEAARVSSPHSRDRHGASGTFYAERNRDPQFAVAWDSAIEVADARLEREAFRRAAEGTERGIFQRGQRVIDFDGKPATEREYSDRLLEVLLRARLPQRYADKRQVEVNGHVEHTVQERLYLTPMDLIGLTIEERRQLMGILSKVARNRGEYDAGGTQAPNDIPALPAPGDGQ